MVEHYQIGLAVQAVKKGDVKFISEGAHRVIWEVTSGDKTFTVIWHKGGKPFTCDCQHDVYTNNENILCWHKLATLCQRFKELLGD